MPEISESALGEFRNHFILPSISILSRLSRPLSTLGTRAQNVSFSLITKQTSSSIKQRDDPRLPRQTIRRRLAVVAHTTTITTTVWA